MSKEGIQIDRFYIGSGDIASICRVPGAFSSPYNTAAKKKGLVPESETTEYMEVGNALESYVLSRYERQEGATIGAYQVHLRHPEWNFAGCTVDGLIFDENQRPVRIVEAKTTGDYSWDEVPLKYEAQVQWQLGIFGLEEADLTVLHLPNRQQKTYRIPFTPVVFDSMLDACIEFWNRYVLTDRMPPVDGHPQTTDALKFIRAAIGKEVVADSLAEKVQALRMAKLMKKEAEERCKALENELKVFMGDAEVALIDGKAAFTWKQQKGRTGFDSDALKKDLPAVFEKYVTVSEPSRTFRLCGE